MNSPSGFVFQCYFWSQKVEKQTSCLVMMPYQLTQKLFSLFYIVIINHLNLADIIKGKKKMDALQTFQSSTIQPHRSV